MSAVLISRPSSVTDRVLLNHDLSRDQTGLDQLVESYTIRASQADALIPAQGTLHKGWSGMATQYPYMGVETINLTRIPGDLAILTVGYSGSIAATPSQFPRPFVRAIPLTPGNYLHFPYRQMITYVTPGGIQNELRLPSPGAFVPAEFLQGSEIMASPVAPYESSDGERTDSFIPPGSTLATGSNLKLVAVPYTFKKIRYYGLRVSSVGVERRGPVLVVTLSIEDSFEITDVQTTRDSLVPE